MLRSGKIILSFYRGGCDLAKVTQQVSGGALAPNSHPSALVPSHVAWHSDSSSFHLPGPRQSPEAGPSAEAGVGAEELGVLPPSPHMVVHCPP